MSIDDIVTIKDRAEIISSGDAKVEFLQEKKDEGLISDDQRYQEVIKV